MKIISVVGARPNFMKIAPFIHAIATYNASLADTNAGTFANSPAKKHIEHILVHTGQHYDDAMSKSFFESLEIPEADINLGIGSGSHAEQVGSTMIAFEKVLLSEKPDWVVVVGDVNATAACSMVAKKCGVRVAHIEAGLRSHDMDMPEEINRLVADCLSDLLLTPDPLSSKNLERSVRDDQQVVFVGNIMIDTLEAQREKAMALDIDMIVADSALDGQPAVSKLEEGEFAIVTMHRPSNVDARDTLEPIVRFLIDEAAPHMPVVWTVHPRTAKNLAEFGLMEELLAHERIILTSPLGYHELLRLNAGSRMALTDSGGLQEECCVLGTVCLVLRFNTERPVTLRENGGAGVLVGNDPARIRAAFNEALAHPERVPSRPELWDGHTAGRIVEALVSFC